MQFVTDQGEEFIRARLDDVGEHPREDGARRTIADAGDLDGGVFLQQRGGSAAVAMLDALGLGNRCAQADGEVVGEVVPADGDRTGVADDSAAVDD